jgi:hypothetical protein
VLKAWEKRNGLKRLLLIGDIKNPLRSSLATNMLVYQRHGHHIESLEGLIVEGDGKVEILRGNDGTVVRLFWHGGIELNEILSDQSQETLSLGGDK